jgi:hypothetical protein
LKVAGPSIGTGSSFCQTSSRPNASLVGTPVALCRVGSGAIHSLYQACTPGSDPSALAVPTSAEPVAGFFAIALSSAISVHVEPKSFET